MCKSVCVNCSVISQWMAPVYLEAAACLEVSVVNPLLPRPVQMSLGLCHLVQDNSRQVPDFLFSDTLLILQRFSGYFVLFSAIKNTFM